MHIDPGVVERRDWARLSCGEAIKTLLQGQLGVLFAIGCHP
jgi:hypothetical protein